MSYRDEFIQNKSLTGVVLDALVTDGGHHKQWYLDQILRKLIGQKEYEDLRGDKDYGDWELGVAP